MKRSHDVLMASTHAKTYCMYPSTPVFKRYLLESGLPAEVSTTYAEIYRREIMPFLRSGESTTPRELKVRPASIVLNYAYEYITAHADELHGPFTGVTVEERAEREQLAAAELASYNVRIKELETRVKELESQVKEERERNSTLQSAVAGLNVRMRTLEHSLLQDFSDTDKLEKSAEEFRTMLTVTYDIDAEFMDTMTTYYKLAVANNIKEAMAKRDDPDWDINEHLDSEAEEEEEEETEAAEEEETEEEETEAGLRIPWVALFLIVAVLSFLVCVDSMRGWDQALAVHSLAIDCLQNIVSTGAGWLITMLNH